MINEEKRPVLHIPYSTLEKVLEIASLIGIIINIFVLIKYLPSLPETIPTHFGALGKPDDWGSKNSLLIMPIIAIIIAFLLTILSKFPHIYNYVTPITPQNAEVQYRNARSMMIVLKTIVIYIFTYIQMATIRVALGNAKGLSIAFLPVFLILTFGSIIYYIRRSLKFK